MQQGLKFVVHPTSVRIVHVGDLEDFISRRMEKWYNLDLALGGSVKPGRRFTFDLRSVKPSVERAQDIGRWVNQGAVQPAIEAMLSNLVASEQLAPAMYIVAAPSVEN
jgi:hypothetical protein